ncbi:MAG: putative ABC transporter ATP-binding protein [Firmicutes bacterium]|nr:putative ABC transporter ATP-binding protein [candidate division NPL-UPA2 bacterium]
MTETQTSIMPLLEVCNLSISFTQYMEGLRQKSLQAISNLSIDVRAGEVIAVLGSSGSGKSLLAHAILGILPSNAMISGKMRYAGENLTPERQASLRGREIALVPQSISFLDPLMRVGEQVRPSMRNGNSSAIQREIFARYHLAAGTERLFPFQLSGGMARRVLISIAAATNARLVIADEPTPGLHPTVVKETLAHLRELADEGDAVLLITHDIAAALEIANRIAVFYAGTTIEIAPASDFSGEAELLRHPYSKALWQALPQNNFIPLQGSQPYPDALPPGCLFEPRCQLSSHECEAAQPEPRHLRGGTVRCFHAA